MTIQATYVLTDIGHTRDFYILRLKYALFIYNHNNYLKRSTN